MLVNHLNQLASYENTLEAANVEVDSHMGLWVPGEYVLVFRLELPKVSKRKQQEMLPWLLEDRLLSSPDDFEFFLGASVGDSQNLVYALEKTRIRQWLQITDAASVTSDRFAPDFLALSYEEGRWSVYAEEGRLLVRTGIYEGFAVDSDFGWQQIELLISQQDTPVRLSLISSDDIQVPDALKTMVDDERGEQGRINWEFAALPLGIDLLPSSYKPKSENPLVAWSPVAACFGLLILFVLTYMFAQSWLWQRDIQVLKDGVAATYQSLFSQEINSLSDGALKISTERHLSLLEHQYIGLQTAPLDAMVALDSALSACNDCALLMIEQTDNGVLLRLKDDPQVRRRFTSLDGWEINWSSVDEKGYAAVNLTSVAGGSN